MEKLAWAKAAVTFSPGQNLKTHKVDRLAIWEKLGQVFKLDSPVSDWMQTHAANPVAEHIKDDLFRVYFSCRDRKQRASIGWVEMDISQPGKAGKLSDQPVLSTVPWRNTIGLAISAHPDAPFERASLAPVMDRSDEDPYSISYPCVIKDAEIYRMLYGSNLGWGPNQTDMAHCLKYAESNDGIHWRRSKEVAFKFRSPSEYAMSKPSIIKDPDRYRAWYSYRGASYRIGYAESTDGIHWQRQDDQIGIDVASKGWDSESIEYPFVFDHKGKRYMLYNGNRYGLTGIGLAVQTAK